MKAWKRPRKVYENHADTRGEGKVSRRMHEKIVRAKLKKDLDKTIDEVREELDELYYEAAKERGW